MAEQLIAFAALIEVLGSVASTYIRQFISVCNFSSRGSVVLPASTYIRHTCTYT